MATQRGRSSADWLRSATTEHGPPKPGQGFATISDMISKLIESESTETIMKVSKSECCIKEMILHMGTPSLLTHDKIPLTDRSCQDLGAWSDKRTGSHKFLERPRAAPNDFRALRASSDFSAAGHQFMATCRAFAFADLLDEMMASINAPTELWLQ